MYFNKSYALEKLLSHAYHEVEHYYKVFNHHKIDIAKIQTPSDLIQIPFLSRLKVQKEPSVFLSRCHHKFPYNQRIQIKRTFGVFGMPLRVYWDQKDESSANKSLWDFRNKWYQINSSMRMCSFYNARYIGNKLAVCEGEFIDNNGLHLNFSKNVLTNEKLREYMAGISTFAPDFLCLQPSIAHLLAEIICNERLLLPSNLKYIELSGEFLDDDTRELIKTAFNITPTNVYSTGETNVIAVECKHKSLHVAESNVLIEIVKDGKQVVGESGSIYVTSLTNFAMPFIRYRTGDIGMLQKDPCSCGEKSPVLRLSKNESACHLFSLNGEQISSSVIRSIVEHTNEKMLHAISWYRIQQIDSSQFNIEFSLKPAYKNWQKSIVQAFKENTKDPRLKQAKWSFIFDTNVCQTQSQEV